MTHLSLPPDFGLNGEDPPLYSYGALVEQYFFTSQAAAPESRVAAVLHLLTARPAALSAVGRDPALLAQLAAIRTSQRAPSSRIGSASLGQELKKIYTGGNGLPLAAFAWLISLLTYGLAVVVFAIVAFARVRAAPSSDAGGAGALGEDAEVRRMQITQRWEREAQIEQLAPGTTSTITTRFRLGITREQARDLSLHLGLPGVGDGFPGLRSHLAETLRAEESQEIEKSVQLSNDRVGYYRRIALWRLVNVVHVDALTIGAELHWTQRSSLEYGTSSSVATSFVDLPRRDVAL